MVVFAAGAAGFPTVTTDERVSERFRCAGLKVSIVSDIAIVALRLGAGLVRVDGGPSSRSPNVPRL